jgi:predicted unusual protein kinase regulating ubiquinone biosynthesis (AarF/ABC1/UbiB family)
MLRSLRAFWLLTSVLGSYGLQYLIVRASFGRLFRGRWPKVHARNARRLRLGFTRLRGVFIKMGQVISVLGGFLPDVYREQLDALQDSVPPQPFSDVRERLREAFGEGAVERFASFDREPIAAASLAQVHRATLGNGRQVAVKVLYRGIETLIARDLFVLRCFVPIVSRVFPVVRFERVLGQLSEMLAHETDFDHERSNMERVRGIFAERPDVVVPQTIEELSSRSVLTMSFEEGWKISDLEGQRAAGISPESVARLLTDSYFTMLFAHRVLHADPHPGNFLVRPGPTLIILDHGAVEPLRIG